MISEAEWSRIIEAVATASISTAELCYGVNEWSHNEAIFCKI
jgi:hypothetical protein